MSVDIAGMIRNYGKRSMKGFFNDEEGKELSDSEARKYLADCQKKGWKLIPMGECDGFDYLGAGCPGHPIDTPIKSEK